MLVNYINRRPNLCFEELPIGQAFKVEGDSRLHMKTTAAGGAAGWNAVILDSGILWFCAYDRTVVHCPDAHIVNKQ